MAFAAFFNAGSSEARTWTQAATGKQIEADLVRVDGADVILKLGGRLVKVPAGSLSLEDQAYIKEQAAAGGGGDGEAVSGTAWPNWRGPNHDNISPDTGLLKSWPEGGPKKAWVYENAGVGYSGPSIVNGKLFTMGTRGDNVVAICLDVSNGEEVWSKKFGEDDGNGYSAGWGKGPRSTPTWSDGKIYCLGPKGTLACLQASDGKEEWSKNLVDDFSGKLGGWGFAESPFVDGGKVVVGPGGDVAGIVALDKNSGETLWEAKGVTPGKPEYASVAPLEAGGKRQYVRLFEKQVVGVAADSGDLLWSSEWKGRTATIPTPIISGDEVFVTTGYGVGSKLLKIGAGGEVEEKWSNSTMKNKHGGVVKVGDHLYGFSEGGGFVCLDWKTGELVWNEKGQLTSNNGAVCVADGMLYCQSESGDVFLIPATPDGFELKGSFTLEPQSKSRDSHKGKVWTVPVVLDGKLFLRDQEFVHCYDVRG